MSLVKPQWKHCWRWMAVWESEGQRVPIFLSALSLPQTDQVTNSFVCLCHREGRTFLRLTSSRRRWWWRGGWGTWGSWARSSTGSATAKKPTASDAATSAYVSTHLLRPHEMLNIERWECWVTPADLSRQLLWESCDKCRVSVISLHSQRRLFLRWVTGKSGVHFWCASDSAENTTRTKFGLPGEHFRQCVCSVKSSS